MRFAVIGDLDRVDTVVRRTSQLTVPLDGLDFVFLHQEVEAFRVLGDDLVLAVLNGRPVQLPRIHAFNAKLFGFFQVIPQFRVEQQRLGRNAAHMEAGSAEESVLFDECGFQAVLAGADGAGISGGPAANDGYVINGFWQSRAPPVGTDENGQTNDSRTGSMWGPNTRALTIGLC